MFPLPRAYLWGGGGGELAELGQRSVEGGLGGQFHRAAFTPLPL